MHERLKRISTIIYLVYEFFFTEMETLKGIVGMKRDKSYSVFCFTLF